MEMVETARCMGLEELTEYIYYGKYNSNAAKYQ
jgi:hypothetical protein